jgi:hypothetical protein
MHGCVKGRNLLPHEFDGAPARLRDAPACRWRLAEDPLFGSTLAAAPFTAFGESALGSGTNIGALGRWELYVVCP